MALSLALSPGAIRSGAGPAVPRTHVFLLGGQSNMMGKAPWDGGSDYPAGVLQVARSGALSGGTDGALVPAAHQLDYPNANPGYFGPPLQFALDWVAANPDDTLVLVPCAVDGTGLADNRWNQGDDLYTDAVTRLNALFAAHPDYLMGGFLIELGEADAKLNNPGIIAGIGAMVEALRVDVTKAGPATPLMLTGPLASFATAWPASNVADVRVDLTHVPDQVAYSAMIDTDDLTDKGDNVHYDTVSARMAGGRLFTALATARVNSPKAPPAPYSLTATPEDGQIAATVPAIHNATSYTFEWKASADSSWTALSPTASNAATIPGLTNGTSYDIRAKAGNALGESGYATVTGITPTASSPVEVGAVGHWLLGSDNAGHLGLVGGNLSENATYPPTLNAGYVAISGANQLAGLTSPLSETAARTVCMVIRNPSATAAAVMGGTLSFGGTGGTSLVFGSDGQVRFNQNVAAGGVEAIVIAPSWAASTWLFVAASIDASGNLIGYVGDTTSPVTATGSFADGRNLAPSSTKIGVGNVAYNHASFAHAYDIAEAIVFDSALSAAEIAAVYGRSLTRLSDRGISLA